MLVIPRNRPSAERHELHPVSLRYCKRSPVAWPRAGTRFSHLILSDKPLEIDAYNMLWVSLMIIDRINVFCHPGTLNYY